jgi:hypothetical protein
MGKTEEDRLKAFISKYGNFSKVSPNLQMIQQPSIDSFVDDFIDWLLLNSDRILFVQGLGVNKSNHKSGSWVQYNWKTPGTYSPRDELNLRDMIYVWLKQNNLRVEDHNVNEVLKRMMARFAMEIGKFDVYDPNSPIINCLSGIYHPHERVLYAHNPDTLTLNQIEYDLVCPPSELPDQTLRNAEDMNSLIKLEELMPCWMSLKSEYPDVMHYYERYLQMILYQDNSHKLQLFIVGRPNSGKSTIATVSNEIFKDVASYIGMEELGEKWGMMPLVGKHVNIDTDSGMGFFNKLALTRLKKIIGDPGKPIATPLIYGGYANVVFSPFFITFCNQFTQLPPRIKVRAWFKRSFCLVMNKQFKDDPDFEVNLLKEIRYIFNYLLLLPYRPISREADFGSLDEFINRNMRIWEEWSDPLRQAIRENFEYSDKEDDCFKAEDVEFLVMDKLEKQHVTVNNLDLKLPSLFRQLRIRSDSIKDTEDKRKNIKIFRNIKQREPVLDENKLENPVYGFISNQPTDFFDLPKDVITNMKKEITESIEIQKEQKESKKKKEDKKDITKKYKKIMEDMEDNDFYIDPEIMNSDE